MKDWDSQSIRKKYHCTNRPTWLGSRLLLSSVLAGLWEEDTLQGSRGLSVPPPPPPPPPLPFQPPVPASLPPMSAACNIPDVENIYFNALVLCVTDRTYFVFGRVIVELIKSFIFRIRDANVFMYITVYAGVYITVLAFSHTGVVLLVAGWLVNLK